MVNKIKKVIKRKVPMFKRPNYGAKGRSRIKDNWRSQRGNDNHMRVKKKNVGVMPMIGFKNSEKVRFLRQDGTVEVVVHNKAELEMIVGKEGITAKFAHGLSNRKRVELQKIADEKKVRISNKLRAEAKPADNAKKAEVPKKAEAQKNAEMPKNDLKG